MSEQAWAVLIGAATVASLRIIDFFFPKGRWFTWGGRTSRDDAKEDAELAQKRQDEDARIAKRRKARDRKRGDDDID